MVGLYGAPECQCVCVSWLSEVKCGWDCELCCLLCCLSLECRHFDVLWSDWHTHTQTQTLAVDVPPFFFKSLHSLEINFGWLPWQLTQQTQRLRVCLCLCVAGHSVSLLKSKGCRWPCSASLPLLSLPLTSFKIKALYVWSLWTFSSIVLGSLKKTWIPYWKPVLCLLEGTRRSNAPKQHSKFYKHNLVAVCRTYVQLMKLLSASLFSQTAHRCLKRFL